MKAMNVDRNTKVVITDTGQIRIPPSALPLVTGDVITILNHDGMYVNAVNEDGDRVYLAAWTDVTVIDGL